MTALAGRGAPLLAICLALAGCGASETKEAPPPSNAAIETPTATPTPTPKPLPDVVRVRLETGEGPITLALDVKRAPITAANFVRYVEEGRLDGTSFYRAAPTKGTDAAEGRGFIQGGIRRNYRRMLPPIAHEPTSETGLKHEAGTISMARKEPGSAMGEFFITASAVPAMDASGDDPGYAAFGKVVEGMGTVRRILAAPTVPNAGRGGMRDQMIKDPVPIVKAERLE